ncbi:MAG: hypothetical protein ACI31F_05970 [Muribaculaceae bacterium]
MAKRNHSIFISAVLLLIILSTACSNKNKQDSGDILVTVGNAVLTLDDLRKQLPSGLSAEDSTALAHSFIRSWIDSRLISEIASQNIGDLTEIDRMTEQYRNELITYEYRRRMFDDRIKSEITEDSIKKYYDENPVELKLQRPILKGIYLKIPNESPSLKNAKKWYVSTKTEDIDKLEKQCLDGAIHYDYFRDRWVDWERIESLIPAEFGSDPDAFLATHKNLEISQGDFTYLLSISEYIPSGKTMPYEFAKETIKDILAYSRRAEYDRLLRLSLLKEAEDNGQITINCKLD